MSDNNMNKDVEVLVSEILENEGVEDGKLVITAGSSKGDGYLSIITRMDVLGKNKTLHLLLKCSPKNAEFRKVAPVHLVFQREIKFYSQIYPEMKKFQEEKNVLKPFKSAKCYKTDCTEFNEILVLENLCKKGFVLWDKRLPMDENHIMLLLKEYAKLHAVSYGLEEQKPEIFAELTTDLSNLFTPGTFAQDYFDSMAMCLDKVENIFIEQEDIVYKIKHLKKNMHNYLMYIYNRTGKFPTIVHGDSWCNNMMFKYEDPKNKLNPSEIYLVDFQLCFLNSPIVDLSYFLYSNSSKESLKKLDYYLDTYHEHLSSHLQALGCKSIPVSIDNIKWDWPLYCKYGYLMALVVTRAALIDSDEALNITELLESGRSVSDLFFRDFKYKDVMDEKYYDLTKHMYENGFLDFEN